MSEITYSEYWTEVEALAKQIVSEAMDQADNDPEQTEEIINDLLLHETIDSHRWIIYNAYNLDVIKHSENDDYYEQNFGTECLAQSLQDGGLDLLHCHIAFWALYADVYDKINDIMKESEAA